MAHIKEFLGHCRTKVGERKALQKPGGRQGLISKEQMTKERQSLKGFLKNRKGNSNVDLPGEGTPEADATPWEHTLLCSYRTKPKIWRPEALLMPERVIEE